MRLASQIVEMQRTLVASNVADLGGGGGSGGAIWIEAPDRRLLGGGMLQANGGDGGAFEWVVGILP